MESRNKKKNINETHISTGIQKNLHFPSVSVVTAKYKRAINQEMSQSDSKK